MATERSPAFQFYPKDFLTDSHVVAMTLQERGAYITLLCLCWMDGSLPIDLPALARLCHVSTVAFTRLWKALEPCFTVAGGRLVQPRVERERLKQATYREIKAAAGQKGGRASAEAKQTLSTAVAGIAADSTSPSPSPSPSPFSDLVKKHSLPVNLDECWERFKATYPGKGREQGFMAQQWFIKGCEDVGVDAVMAGVERYAKSKTVREGYVLGMLKWLEKGLWIQDPDVPEEQQAARLRLAQEHLAKIDAERAARGR